VARNGATDRSRSASDPGISTTVAITATTATSSTMKPYGYSHPDEPDETYISASSAPSAPAEAMLTAPRRAGLARRRSRWASEPPASAA
jgi:hypothetical protein